MTNDDINQPEQSSGVLNPNRNKTIITVVNANINPSAKYREPNKKYFKEGRLVRSSIG